MSRICLFITIGLFLIQINEANKFIQTSLSKSPNIYFEPLETLTFTTGRWHILANVNILEVLNFGYEILNTFKELTDYCENDCKYNDLTLQITDREEKMKSVLKEISLILENISDITLSNDTQDFKAAINKMEKVNDSTVHWTEKNIFVFPYHVTNIYKKNTLVNDIITKFKDWHIKYPNSTNSLYEIFEISWITTIKAAIHQYLLNLKQLSTNLAFAINGNWNPTLLSEINFNSIKNMISTSPQHSLPNNYHLSDFLKISQVQLFFYKNRLIISLTLPFISEEKYQILKPYSIPVYHKFDSNFTMAIFIKSSISYLAISHDKQSYFLLDEYLFNSCHLTQIGKVCTFTPPTWSTINNPICETTLLTENMLYQCPFYLKISNNIQWTSLKFYNGWFYSTPFTTKIQLHCPKSPSLYITLNNSGILQTQPDCIIESNNLILPQINSKSKSLVKIIPTTGHSISLQKIAPNLYDLSLNSNQLLKNLFSTWNNNEIISLSILEQQLFTFLQFQKSYNKKTDMSKDFKTLSFYTLIVTIIVIIISLFFMILGITLYLKIHKNSKTIQNLEPPATHQNLNPLENEPIQLEHLKTSHSQPKFWNTLV